MINSDCVSNGLELMINSECVTVSNGLELMINSECVSNGLESAHPGLA